MQAPCDLKGKVCLVTGGSRGIGQAVALALAEAGADVVINYQRSQAMAEEVCEMMKRCGVRAQAYQADISNEEEANNMCEKILSDFGPVSVLVNNAGITRDKSFAKMTRQLWDEVLGVNLNGPFNVTHALLQSMISMGWGRIINIASVVGQMGNFGQANYAVTKGGLIAFTMTLAREVARKGITVNAVAPGYIETDMMRDVVPAVIDQVKAHDPARTPGQTRRSRGGCRLPRQPGPSYVTGQVLAVNGGMYMFG